MVLDVGTQTRVVPETLASNGTVGSEKVVADLTRCILRELQQTPLGIGLGIWIVRKPSPGSKKALQAFVVCR